MIEKKKLIKCHHCNKPLNVVLELGRDGYIWEWGPGDFGVGDIKVGYGNVKPKSESIQWLCDNCKKELNDDEITFVETNFIARAHMDQIGNS